MTIENDLEIIQGDDFRVSTTAGYISGATFDCYGNPVGLYVPYDITNDTFYGSIVDDFDCRNVLSTFTFQKVDPVNGRFDFFLTTDETSALTTSSFANSTVRIAIIGSYDVHWISATLGVSITFMKGKVKLSRTGSFE